MEKRVAQDYVADLEDRIDRVLSKWKKMSKIENGEVVQLEWQFEQAHIIIDVFWHDHGEHVNLACFCPRMTWKNEWAHLDLKTATKVMDRVGNFAQIAQSKHH